MVSAGTGILVLVSAQTEVPGRDIPGVSGWVWIWQILDRRTQDRPAAASCDRTSGVKSSGADFVCRRDSGDRDTA